jgi:DNA-binding NtrC family response regulator
VIFEASVRAGSPSFEAAPDGPEIRLKLLQAYDWPGNIRELQNVIERAVILHEGETFSVDETWFRRELPVARGRGSALNSVLARQEKERGNSERSV